MTTKNLKNIFHMVSNIQNNKFKKYYYLYINNNVKKFQLVEKKR